jgi:hypothetical protein
MANALNRVCPFSHRGCAECSFYIGRHNFTNFSDKHKCAAPVKNLNFDHIFLQLSGKTPNAIKDAESDLPDIRVKVINLVSEETHDLDMAEAAKWEWRNPEQQRFINGTLHVTSWGQLLEYCRRREEKGDKEVIIYESPDHLMASGG